MLDFDSYNLVESVNKMGSDKMTREEEQRLANIFNKKYGRGFIKDISVNAGKDKQGDDVKITFTDTVHVKARFTQRFPDLSPKDVTRIIKTIGLGAYRTKPEYFYTGHTVSILVFSKSKDVGIYVVYQKDRNDDLNFKLITILPKGRSATSRDDDVRMMVESVDEMRGTTSKMIYIDESSFYEHEVN